MARRILAAMAAVCAMAFASDAAAAPQCQPEGGLASAQVAGAVRAGQTLELAAGPYRMVLEPNEYGWRFQVRSSAGAPLPIVVPPSHPPGPMQPALLGFLYRNGDNSDASALGQLERPIPIRFQFGADARDPLLHPELNIVPQQTEAAAADYGIVELELLDYGLADLEAGQRARMVYARFEGCVSWREQSNEVLDQSLEFTAEDVEMFGACGLDLMRYRLAAHFAPRVLSADLDGDGAHDHLAPVVSGERRGVAVCRAGTYLTMLGFEPQSADTVFQYATLHGLESWRVVPAGNSGVGGGYDPPWPEADGDVIVLERFEKEMELLFMQGGRFSGQQVYRYVEP